MKKIILTILSLILMVGCSSSLPDKHYYQLTSDFDSSARLQTLKADNFIWIESINVANFLDKTGIIYQTNSIEYATANSNLWLTALSDQLQQRVVQDLSILLPNKTISSESLSTPSMTIKLFIDGFHGAYTGDAIIKGHWLITNNKSEIITKNFDYRLRLDQDGYQTLVETLSKGWQEEELDLAKTIKPLL